MNRIIKGIEDWIEMQIKCRNKVSYEDTAIQLAINSGALNTLYQLQCEISLLKRIEEEKLNDKTYW